MTKQKVKGSGSRLNNSITLGQKIKLAKWVEGKKDDGRSYHDLALTASAELGFTVTDSQIQNFWREVNGPRNSRSASHGIKEMMNEVYERIRNCELAIMQLNTEFKFTKAMNGMGDQ